MKRSTCSSSRSGTSSDHGALGVELERDLERDLDPDEASSHVVSLGFPPRSTLEQAPCVDVPALSGTF
jgi:hypothetical protein